MSSQLSILSYQNHSIDSLIKNGEMFFRATQLAELLEYQNPHDAIKKHVDTDDLAKYEVIDSLGRKQKVNFVNESGMYSLILGSKQKSAKKVKKWVTSEVLPVIRKTGSYSLTINKEQQQAIKQAVNEQAYRTGKHYQAIYTKLYEAFKIPRYQDLPAIKFDEAMKWLGGVKNKQITESNLQCLINHSLWIANFWRENQMYKAFKMIGSDFGVRINDHVESCYTLSLGLERELEQSKMIALK